MLRCKGVPRVKIFLTGLVRWWRRRVHEDLTRCQAARGEPDGADRTARERGEARAVEDAWRQQQQGPWVP